MFVIFSILLTVFNNNSNATIIKNDKTDNNISCLGYIIQLNKESILEFKNKLKINIKNWFLNLSEHISNIYLLQNIKDYKKQLLLNQKNAKLDICRILNKNESSQDIFFKEFINVFNGIYINNISDEFIQKIRDLPYVKDIIPNSKISVTLDLSIPLINADDVWQIKDSYGFNVTGKGVTIAILDTGVDYTHPDLKDNYIQEGSYDFIDNDTDPMDDYGHGTHCAGIICGKGYSSNFQYVGVAPDAKYYAIKILNGNGEGSFATYLSGMEKALDPNSDGDYSDHAHIISLSFGTNEPGRPDDLFCKVVDNVVKEGVVVVVAAGNLGPRFNTITSPGCAKQSICVGSTDKFDFISSTSSRGPVEFDGDHIVKPDIVAPGVNIISTKNGGGYTIKSGTSMATPHVAGVVALILQANPDISPENVKKVLKENAKNLGYDQNVQGSGRVDALNIFKEDKLYIDVPSEIDESKWFMVKIKDKNDNPVKALVLFTIPFHLPRLRYGSSVIFRAPTIFLDNKENLNCKIKVFKKDSNELEVIQKDIIILNKK